MNKQMTNKQTHIFFLVFPFQVWDNLNVSNVLFAGSGEKTKKRRQILTAHQDQCPSYTYEHFKSHSTFKSPSDISSNCPMCTFYLYYWKAVGTQHCGKYVGTYAHTKYSLSSFLISMSLTII